MISTSINEELWNVVVSAILNRIIGIDDLQNYLFSAYHAKELMCNFEGIDSIF